MDGTNRYLIICLLSTDNNNPHHPTNLRAGFIQAIKNCVDVWNAANPNKPAQSYSAWLSKMHAQSDVWRVWWKMPKNTGGTFGTGWIGGAGVEFHDMPPINTLIPLVSYINTLTHVKFYDNHTPGVRLQDEYWTWYFKNWKDYIGPNAQSDWEDPEDSAWPGPSSFPEYT